MRIKTPLVALLGLTLAGCSFLYPPTPTPDYTIGVRQTPTGSVAVPPTCPSWVTEHSNPYDNQPLPQFGCSNARNLALMVDRPDDLLKGRTLDDASGVLSVGSMRRYNANQTRGLIDPSSADTSVASTTSSTPNSTLSGDAAGNSTGSAAAAAP